MAAAAAEAVKREADMGGGAEHSRRREAGPTLKIVIPPEVGPRIIGTKGANLREISQLSGGAFLTLADSERNGTRVLFVKGTQYNTVSAAACLVVGRLWQLLGQPGSVRLSLLIPCNATPFLVGRSGANVKRVEETTGALLSLAREPSQDGVEQELTLSGPWEAVQRSVAAVVETLAVAAAKLGNLAPGYCDTERHGGRVDIAGPQQYTGRKEGQDDLAAAPAAGLKDFSQLTVRVQLPEGLPLGAFIGKDGSFLRELSRQCQVHRIHIDNGWMQVTGDLQGLNRALWHAAERWRRLCLGERVPTGLDP